MCDDLVGEVERFDWWFQGLSVCPFYHTTQFHLYSVVNVA